jgi:NAD(P)-dependent dehydrogenase (short-subunit alcohol dehydrogenase family)
MYHATKFGIEGFCESVAQEVAPFNIGITLVEPGGARTEFRYGSAQVANLMPEYDGNPAHRFLNMLDASNGLAPGDPVRMFPISSQALANTISTLTARILEYEKQIELAASTDFPAGE